MVERCKRLAESGAFQNAVLGLIIVNAVAMGLETWPSACWASVFQALNVGVQVAFGLELAVRIIGHGRRPQDSSGRVGHLTSRSSRWRCSRRPAPSRPSRGSLECCGSPG
jgi:hypothetical protein